MQGGGSYAAVCGSETKSSGKWFIEIYLNQFTSMVGVNRVSDGYHADWYVHGNNLCARAAQAYRTRPPTTSRALPSVLGS